MRRQNNSPRIMTARFAGKCACCGADIKAGETITWYPSRKQIAHVGGLDGNSARCTAEIRKRMYDPGFVDLDRMHEDQCAEMTGR
jgi:hypothetical protein